MHSINQNKKRSKKQKNKKMRKRERMRTESTIEVIDGKTLSMLIFINVTIIK